MIQISKEDAAFILNELNQRAQHQINSWGAISEDLQGVINDLDAQIYPVQDAIEEAPQEAVAAFMGGVPHEQFDEDTETNSSVDDSVDNTVVAVASDESVADTSVESASPAVEQPSA
jgi:hypothetical protein